MGYIGGIKLMSLTKNELLLISQLSYTTGILMGAIEQDWVNSISLSNQKFINDIILGRDNSKIKLSVEQDEVISKIVQESLEKLGHKEEELEAITRLVCKACSKEETMSSYDFISVGGGKCIDCGNKMVMK